MAESGVSRDRIFRVSLSQKPLFSRAPYSSHAGIRDLGQLRHTSALPLKGANCLRLLISLGLRGGHQDGYAFAVRGEIDILRESAAFW
jgi:hypothetical protein